MKSTVRKPIAMLIAVTFLFPCIALLGGCGNDDGDPPSDPAYYKGEMKPKDTTAGPQGQ